MYPVLQTYSAVPAPIWMLHCIYSQFSPFFFFCSEDKGLETEIGDLINLHFCIKIQRGFQRSWFFLLHFDSFGTFLERQVRKLHFHSLSFPQTSIVQCFTIPAILFII